MNSLASSLQEDLGTLNIEIVHISKRINARNLQLPLLKQLSPSLWLPVASKPGFAARQGRSVYPGSPRVRPSEPLGEAGSPPGPAASCPSR